MSTSSTDQTTEEEFPQWVRERAAEVCNTEAGALRESTPWTARDFLVPASLRYAILRLIAKHEPKPVDPDLVLARELMALCYERLGWSETATQVRAGKCDDTHLVRDILAKIKEHRA